jgi:hypothetical protein
VSMALKPTLNRSGSPKQPPVDHFNRRVLARCRLNARSAFRAG